MKQVNITIMVNSDVLSQTCFTQYWRREMKSNSPKSPLDEQADRSLLLAPPYLDKWNLFGIATAYILYEIFMLVADIKEDLRDE